MGEVGLPFQEQPDSCPVKLTIHVHVKHKFQKYTVGNNRP